MFPFLQVTLQVPWPDLMQNRVALSLASPRAFLLQNPLPGVSHLSPTHPGLAVLL